MSYPLNVSSERSEVEVGSFAGGGRYRRFDVERAFVRLVLGPDDDDDSAVVSLPCVENSAPDRLDEVVPVEELGDGPSSPSSISIDRFRFSGSFVDDPAGDGTTMLSGGIVASWNLATPAQHLLAMNVRFPSSCSALKHFEMSAVADEDRPFEEMTESSRINTAGNESASLLAAHTKQRTHQQ